MTEKKNKFKLGEIVRVTSSFLGSEPNSLGYIYEEYKLADPGVSIILEDGKDLGGFSLSEQEMYLEPVYDSGYRYKHTSVMKLWQDWNDGLFKNVFQSAKSFVKQKQQTNG